MQATLALRFGGEGILKVKGIPFKACAADVRKFFSGYKIKVGGVSFIMHADGRPTGMAFIEFATPQEAVRAMVSERAATSSEQRPPRQQQQQEEAAAAGSGSSMHQQESCACGAHPPRCAVRQCHIVCC